MIKDIYVFDDIITKEEQTLLYDFVNQKDLDWTHEKNITGYYGGNQKKFYPANVLPKIKLKNENIIQIINKIEKSVIKKIDLNFVENYRFKINWTRPLDFEYDPIDLLHVDNPVQHIAMVYYINDSTGNTYIYNDDEGNNAENYQKHKYNSIDHTKFSLIKKVTPKMGRVVVFNGSLHHHAEYPKDGDRFIINFNFVAKEKNKSLI